MAAWFIKTPHSLWLHGETPFLQKNFKRLSVVRKQFYLVETPMSVKLRQKMNFDLAIFMRWDKLAMNV